MYLQMQSGMFGSPMAKKNLEMSAFSGQFKSLKDLADFSDNGSLVSSSSNHSNKSESKKHPSLPKEVIFSSIVLFFNHVETKVIAVMGILCHYFRQTDSGYCLEI